MDENDPKYRLNKKDQAIWDEHVRDMDSSSRLELSEEESFEELLNNPSGSLEKDEISEISHVTEEDVQPRTCLKDKNFKEPNGDLQIDKRTAGKIRKGKMQIERRLDLHGLNQTKAYEALKYFITGSYEKGVRCVLVITGKGKSNATSDDWLSPSKGVLKTNLPRWLSEPPLKDKILNVTPAQPKDGGGGAFYVYIRKNKE